LLNYKKSVKNLKEISARLKIAKDKANDLKENRNNSRGTNIGRALKISTEFVAAVAVGSIIGFILDGWFDTKPWLIILFFIIGVAAGMLNVTRSAKKMQKNNNE